MKSCIFFLTTLLAASPAEAGDQGDLQQIRAMTLQLAPKLESMTPMARALELREQVYRSPAARGNLPTASMAELNDWALSYRLSVIERSRANMCGGKILLYMEALKAWGIPSRAVLLFTDRTADKIVTSHASVDVLIGGQWLAQDPTFNTSLRDADGYSMSWHQAVLRLRVGGSVTIEDDGRMQLPGQTWADIPSPLSAYASYAVLGPGGGEEAQNLNPAWDGKISYADGSTFDVWASVQGGIYKSLAE